MCGIILYAQVVPLDLESIKKFHSTRQHRIHRFAVLFSLPQCSNYGYHGRYQPSRTDIIIFNCSGGTTLIRILAMKYEENEVLKDLFDQLNALETRVSTNASLCDQDLKSLFNIYVGLERAAIRCGLSDRVDEYSDLLDILVEKQSDAMAMASLVTATSPTGVLYKLAMWRWDSAELDDTMKRYEAVAYSAFLDLSKMLDVESVLRPDERKLS